MIRMSVKTVLVSFTNVLLLLAMNISESKSNTLENGLQMAQNTLQIRTEYDEQFKDFLAISLKNYSTWLSSHDPYGPVLEPIHLVDKEYIGVLTNLTITNQIMSGHSKTTNEVLTVTSNMEANQFSVHLNWYYGGLLKFEGDYTANGSRLNASGSGVNVPFHGEGKFTSKVNNSLLTLIVLDYGITEDEHIDISIASTLYQYSWYDGVIGFEGVKLGDYEDDGNSAEHLSFIQAALIRLYDLTLEGVIPEGNIPPLKLLLIDYLKEIFQQNKLSDIIPGWQPKPEGTTEASASSLAIHGILISCILVLGLTIL